MKEKILMSVFNKRNISKFAKTLSDSGYRIIASEGTGKELVENGVSFIPAQEISKNPNGFKDCIQAISFNIEAGILFDRLNFTHIEEIKKFNIEPITMVVCNFPPVEEVIKDPEDFNIKNIDVGGPLMVRAAATNFKHVLVVVDPDDYERVSKAIIQDEITDEFRQKLAVKAFTYTHNYDNEIVKYLKRTAHNIHQL